MKRTVLTTIILFLTISHCLGLTARVTDSSGTPLEDVPVTFAKVDTTLYSDSNGEISFNLVSSIAVNYPAVRMANLIYSDNKLSFTLFSHSPIDISIYSPRGQKVLGHKAQMSAGTHTVATSHLAEGLYILHATIGTESITQKIICGSSLNSKEASLSVQNHNSRSSRSQDVDTACFNLRGYKTIERSISSYDNDLGNVVLTPEDFTEGTLVSLRDIHYSIPADSMLTLDLHYYDNEIEKPVVLLIHGGSWVSGDKNNFEELAPDFIPWWLERGYVVAAINFRLATKINITPIVKLVDQASDIATAIAWINSNSGDHSISPDRGSIALGFSSGAHLVALLGADGGYLESVGVPEEYIRATISLDVHAYDVPYALKLMEGSVVEQNIPSIRHLFGSDSLEQLIGSPINYIEGYVAPALLVTAEQHKDSVGTHGYVANMASARYCDSLTATGYKATLYHYNDETHNSLVVDFGTIGDAPTEAVENFLKTLPY